MTVGLSEEMAVIRHRVEQLEVMPPRVNALEMQVAEVNHRLGNVENNLAIVADEGHKTNQTVTEIQQGVNQLVSFSKGGSAAIAILATGASVLITAAYQLGFFG